MVEVADVTEVTQCWRAVFELPAVALGVAVAGAVREGTAALVGQISPSRADFNNDDKSLIKDSSPHTCRDPDSAGNLRKGDPARTATIVTLPMQQIARPTSHGVATLHDLRYTKTDLYRRPTFSDGPASSKPE
jgi:hypothetical protein